MFVLLCLYFVGLFRETTLYTAHLDNNPLLYGQKLESAELLYKTTVDIIQDGKERVAALYKVKLDNLRSAPFEVGYLVQTIQEKYRRMVDKYNTSHFMNKRLYVIELVFYLDEIEHHYWEIEHLVNMAHEIERKYMIRTGIHEDYRNEKIYIANITTPKNPYPVKTRSKKKKPKWQHGFTSTTERYRGRFPFEYGWDVEVASSTQLELEDLLKELSWSLRIKLLQEMAHTTSTPLPLTTTTLSGAVELKSVPTKDLTRRVGVEALVLQDIMIRRQNEDLVTAGTVVTPDDITADENNMRLKLFRLMYETVRDSDLKVRRAELIQNHYSNLTSFQIGYLMGDVTDKFTVINDISSTLERFYRVWKPIEHINAYEQIANQAIEISHLIDLIRMASRESTNTDVRF